MFVKQTDKVVESNTDFGVSLIVTTTRFQVDENSRRELFQTIRSLYQPISQEGGFLACHFYCEIGNEAMVLLVEEWESERHWRDHLQSREFAVFVGAMILVEKPVAVEFKLLSEMLGVDSLKKMRTSRNDIGILDG